MKLTLLSLATLIGGFALSQNVGINTDGSTPTKLLHVKANSATDGVRIQNDAANGDPTLDFNVNGTTRITMGIDDSDADKFKIGTTGLTTNTRMTLTTAGLFGIGTTNPTFLFDVQANNALTGVWTNNLNATGTGMVACGNGAGLNGLLAGSAVSAQAFSTCVYGVFSTFGAGQGALYQDPFGAQWNVGGWTGAAYFKIIGTGGVGTIIDNLEDEKVTMICPEAPENLFMDYGNGKLVNGNAHIDIDPILAKNILVDETHPLKVFVQLEGECNGVYVTNKSKEGFDVKELQNGNSNVSFSYSIIANRASEEFIGPEGQVRVSDYSERWAKAPEYQESYNSSK